MSDNGPARHRARERAFELLYETEMKGRSAQEILAALVVAPDDYTVELIRATETHRPWAEDLLARNSTDWSLERMAVVDRIIMTLALCELRVPDAPPLAVVLDEAVEFAKVYSSDGAPSFVNGVLSACVAEIG